MKNLVSKRISSAISSQRRLFTNFLDLLAQKEALALLKKSNLYYELDGGYEDATYKRLIIDIKPITKSDFAIVTLEMISNVKFTHSQILGSLLALGLKREVIGDVINGDKVLIIVCEHFKQFIIDHFTKINNQPITLQEITCEISNPITLTSKKIVIPSFRLDVIIAKTYHLNRHEASLLITKGYVKINHEIAEKNSQICQLHDIITVRTKGKMQILTIEGVTKKANHLVNVGLY